MDFSIIRLIKFVPLIYFAVSCFPSESNSQVVFPQLKGHKTPSPGPAAPGDIFAPIMSGNASEDTPTCAEWTRTAGPDESLVITGINFSKYTGIDEGKDTRFSVYGSNGQIKDAKIQRLDGDKAIITLDKELPNWSMYLIWPGNENGYGKPIAINQTDAWWVGPEKATKGSITSVYGRNLSQHNDTLTSFVYIKPTNGAGQWAKVNDVNPYKVDFTVPSNLASGEYEVWSHNGHGGEYGWSGPLKLTINDEVNWNQNILNVKDFGAIGNGISDDTQAIQRAINAAEKSHGSTVYFPTGVYMASNTLNLKSNTRYKGEGRNNTVIKCASNFSTSSWGLIQAQFINNYEITDLAFDGNNSFRGNLDPIYLRGSKDGRIYNVDFSFHNYNILDLHLGANIFIQDCTIIGMISFLGNCSQLFIDNCDFKLTNDTENALHSWGGIGISLTNSSCQDYDNSDSKKGLGWGKGRFFVATGNFGSGGYTYIANNRTNDLAVRDATNVDQNCGEQFLWEGFTAVWSGLVASSSASSSTLNAFAESIEIPKIAVITKGRGFGQSRWIVTANGSKIILETPWNVEPDETSTIAVGHFADKIVMYKNYIDGKAYAVSSPNPSASTGIQPYGGIQNFIADNNIIQEVRAGLATWATQHEIGVDPNYFSLYSNNKISNSRWGIQNGVVITRHEGTGVFGTAYRNNYVNNTVESGIVNAIMVDKGFVFDSFIYEHNNFMNVKNGYSTGGDVGQPNWFANGQNVMNQAFYKNYFQSGSNSIDNFGIRITPKVALRDNTFIGFKSTYIGNLPEAVIEAPLHVIEISGELEGNVAESSFILWNSGITVMNWEASANVPWLSITTDSGTIKNERESYIIGLSANPLGLKVGNHIATITITVDNQIKQYTVIFKVTPPNVYKENIASPYPLSNSSLETPKKDIINVYPNPFNQKGNINFKVYKNGNAALQIFSPQGKLIETLNLGLIKAGKEYIYEFDGSTYTNGIYLCRLMCGTIVFTKKLILIR